MWSNFCQLSVEEKRRLKFGTLFVLAWKVQAEKRVNLIDVHSSDRKKNNL